MKIEVYKTYEALSREAKRIILEQLRGDPSLLLCAATGASPTRTYELLAQDYVRQPKLFAKLRIIKLDEWGGLPANHLGSCEHYLQQQVISPLQISAERYLSFPSNPKNPEQVCQRIRKRLADEGPIDVCVLGLGLNGHLALNEPGLELQSHCHVAKLSKKSLQHPMVAGTGRKPAYGLTLGMADILQAKLILVLVSGHKKRAVMQKLMSGTITTKLPASFLWLHKRVFCLVDEAAAP